MAATFALEIVSPEQTVYSGEAISVTAPGSEGSFGVLAHHAPLLAALKAGTLTVTDPAGQAQNWPIRDGFLQAGNNKVIVLATLAS